MLLFRAADGVEQGGSLIGQLAEVLFVRFTGRESLGSVEPVQQHLREQVDLRGLSFFFLVPLSVALRMV